MDKLPGKQPQIRRIYSVKGIITIISRKAARVFAEGNPVSDLTFDLPLKRKERRG